MEHANVIENLLISDKKILSIEELSDHLRKNGVETHAKDDRLTRWLRYLRYVDFVTHVEGKIKINDFQIQSIKKEGNLPKFSKFLDILVEEYNKITVKNKGNVYVKIPVLGESVCKRFEDYGFTTFDFKGYLKKLKKTKIRGKKILFSKPGAREENGVRINDVYYYYISIYD